MTAVCWQSFPFSFLSDFCAPLGETQKRRFVGRTEEPVGFSLGFRQPGLECGLVKSLMSTRVSTAANEGGFRQSCVSCLTDVGVEEGVSSDLSFSCGWSVSKGFLSCEFFDALIKCDLALKPFP